ncbi:MAG: AAA family ATPase, partial [Maritimibacter sp.]|nr:AAA family ATPase [Maritimibacter sp.]
MRFTKLRLNGFKSFVDPTELVIAEGLTGVVGPNGCGKSNLLEALRWVMGENRPTAMRGDGMEDVIFAGAATRPARNFAEVALLLDNSDRLAPAAFNESDILDVVRRITRDAGSAYKVNAKDVRARDVQMLFADASTGSTSPALVRQGQIAELINAKPKNRRRILEEAAGISGLYQRRHEAELKLKGTEANLARVDDVVEQLAHQLAQLARQAKQAARYRAIGAELRQAEGLLLYRRWKEADEARLTAEQVLTDKSKAAAQAEAAARAAARARVEAEDRLPPLREEETIAAAILQRLQVARDQLADQQAQAADRIETLEGRIAQLVRDAEREEALNRDAGETIERLEWEGREIARASEGHEDRLADASEEARGALMAAEAREDALTRLNEEVARLAARHQSAQRLLEDNRKTLARSEAEEARAAVAVDEAGTALEAARAAFAGAETAQAGLAARAEEAEAALVAADEARGQAQAGEAEARAARSEAEGEVTALRAEVTALANLLERDTRAGDQVLDKVRVDPGFEKALGAALADDLRAPAVEAEGSGWALLPDYEAPQPLPAGVTPLVTHVRAPSVLSRRMAQVGLVEPEDGARLQPALLPGQRLVSRAGDLWRWDGLRAGAGTSSSTAALRLEQMNRLDGLKRDLDVAETRATGTREAHETLRAALAQATEADKRARDARREADRAMAEGARALSRAEADQNLAAGKLENLSLAVTRHAEEAEAARGRLAEAEKAAAELPDLEAARDKVEDEKRVVEAARSAMLAAR